MIAKEDFTLHFEQPLMIDQSSGPYDVIQDCQYLWVTGLNKVFVYQFAFVDKNNERAIETYDYLYPLIKSTKFIKLAEVPIPEGSFWIARSHSHAYITNKRTAFTKITKVDLTTRQIVEVIDVPTDKKMMSNLVFSCGKLFMVDKAKTDQLGLDRQYLYFYDTESKTWSAESIPTKKQFTIAHLTAGNDGYVYVANFNNVSISKFSAQTGAFTSIIRTNAFPNAMTASTNREVFVSSFGGMVTRVNTADDSAHNDYSSLGVAESMACVGDSTIWFSAAKPINKKMTKEEKDDDIVKAATVKSGATVLSEDSTDKNDGWPVGTVNPADAYFLGRLNRSNNEVVFTGMSHKKIAYDRWFNDKEDWNIEPIDQCDAKAHTFVTLPFTLKQFDGSNWYSINVIPHLVILTTSKIHLVKLDRELARRGKLELTGQSMISTGSEDYMGDVGDGQLDQ